VFLVGLAIKLLDDLLDEPESLAAPGRPAGWVSPYIVLAFAGAAGFAPATAVSLVLSAYALGMLTSPSLGLPSGLPSWAESLGCVAVGVLLLGPREILGSLLLLAGVQILDDAFDLERDLTADRANIAAALGQGPAYVLGAALWVAAAIVSPVKALAGLVPILAFAALPAAAGWAPRLAILGRPRSVERREPRSWVILGGAAAAAALLGWCGALTGESPGGPAPAQGGAWAEWAALACAAAACVAAVAGTVLAYHRGAARGRRRGSEAEVARLALIRRAEALERPSARPAGPSDLPATPARPRRLG
jgi:hypothetical protein